MNDKAETAWPATWPAWVLETLRELDAAEGIQTVLSFDDAPKWTQRMCAHLVETMAPLAFKSRSGVTGPRFLGTMIGHQQRNLELIEHIPELLELAAPHFEKVWRIIDAAKQRQGKTAYAKWMAWNEDVEKSVTTFFRQVDTVCAQKARIMESVPGRMRNAPLDEQAEYHAGLGASLAIELADDNGAVLHAGSATTVYCLMTAHWRTVTRLRSVAELYMWLCRVAGRPVVGDLDRVKKICQRHGIHFRRRGRPRKE